MFGDLEKTYSAIFGEKYVGVLEKSFGNFGENRSAIWRKPFGANFGDLEKLIRQNRCRRFREIVQRFWRKPFGDFVLELIMEYRNARRPYVAIEK